MYSTLQPLPGPSRSISFAAAAVLLMGQNIMGQTSEPHSSRWEPAIRAFEAGDRTNPPPRNAVEFIGSSSIRLWTNAPSLLPGHRIFNRGFGGSHLADSVAF